MKTILHIGAHRTGTTSFQTYLARHEAGLRTQGIACWGPRVTRAGLFAGVLPLPGARRTTTARRARGRVLLRMERAQWVHGAHTLIVSEENMIGAVARNLRKARLYDDVGERLARYVAAFDGRVDEIVVCIRALDTFWASAAAYNVMRGHPVPERAFWDRVAADRRSWRDVITDVACAAPSARVRVLPYERFLGRPDDMLQAMLGHAVPQENNPAWLNRRPDLAMLREVVSDRGETRIELSGGGERWMPFDVATRAALQETFSDDMFWLLMGADGLATLTEDLDHRETAKMPPTGPLPRGHHHDIEERRLAQPR